MARALLTEAMFFVKMRLTPKLFLVAKKWPLVYWACCCDMKM
jgi:hypothetical protein